MVPGGTWTIPAAPACPNNGTIAQVSTSPHIHLIQHRLGSTVKQEAMLPRMESVNKPCPAQ
jgi:hypothetical protein